MVGRTAAILIIGICGSGCVFDPTFLPIAPLSSDNDSLDSDSCAAGFRFDTSTGDCIDLNECLGSTSGCDQLCINTAGGYECACDAGYALGSDGWSCLEDATCASLECPEGAVCRVAGDEYGCACRPGFEFVAGVCAEIDECLTAECPAGSTCRDEVAAFVCECGSGYELSPQGCTDIDECAIPDYCGEYTTCRNTPGGAQCDCFSGFVADGDVCRDIAECDTAPCGDHAECIERPGSYVCRCDDGYAEGPDGACVDVNECLESSDRCDANARCTNTEGSYRCECQDGFTGDGITCADILECDAAPCDVNADCTELPGSFACDCRSGFSGTGLDCSDIDECSMQMCPENTICSNVVGSYRCDCPNGFRERNGVCEDINECREQQRLCGLGEICENLVGGYRCEIDNECLAGTDDCKIFEICEDRPDGYSCECAPGYRRDRQQCVNINECTERVPLVSERQVSVDTTRVSPGQTIDCTLRISQTGSFERLRVTGLTFRRPGVPTGARRGQIDITLTYRTDDGVETRSVSRDITSGTNGGSLRKVDVGFPRAVLSTGETVQITVTPDPEDGVSELVVFGIAPDASPLVCTFPEGPIGLTLNSLFEIVPNDCQQVCTDTPGSYTCSD